MKPDLFGVTNSNRDFTQRETWGKNQFNSSFPASLVCYMASKNLKLKYIKLNGNSEVAHDYLDPEELLGLKYNNPDLFFSFESDYSPFQKLVVNNLPRIDLVTMNLKNGNCLKGIEIKLTALPDSSTCHLVDDKFGCEIVVRPDTIVYMSLSIILSLKEDRKIFKDILKPLNKITDWSHGINVVPYLPLMSQFVDKILSSRLEEQTPLILQPVWKTNGKSQVLSDNAFDAFVWSNFAFAQLFLKVVKSELKEDSDKITRQTRSVVWLVKMLLDYANGNKINYEKIIDELSYNTRNDKAFSVSGKVSYPFMKCQELTTPRIKRHEVKNIILGGGQNLLSPERRLDSIILNTPGLFN
ncbi:HindVP family restriction endonuclease [bacterium]|nr:HindVP family restriction endonuclease [bacterium]